MTEIGYWYEQMVFHGKGARERALNWTQEFSERLVDGVRYLNVSQTVYVDQDGSALATRNWQVLPDYIKLVKRKTRPKKGKQ